MEKNHHQPEQEEPGIEQYADLTERLFKEIHNPRLDDQGKYYAERRARLGSGQPTWMVRTFQSDSGLVYDFYADFKKIGYIDEDYSSGVSAFIFEADGPRPISEEDISLGRAIIEVETRSMNTSD
jgi:hypothetical protein